MTREKRNDGIVPPPPQGRDGLKPPPSGGGEFTGTLTVLPAPAPIATGPLTRIGTDRVRSVRQADRSWAFNYSITRLDAPDLAALLTAWAPALEAAVRPLRVSGAELTFARPLPEGRRSRTGRPPSAPSPATARP